MKVTFNKPQVLGNKPYAAGTQDVADVLIYNAAFKKLIQSGGVILHARDEMAVKVQAARDAMNARVASKGLVSLEPVKTEQDKVGA